MKNIPSREVHLDFHTTECIEGVGSQYSKENFQEALKLGHLNSITVFGKCHHGFFYYPTEVGTEHPTKEKGFNLAQHMIDDAHEIGVHAPLYISMGYSAEEAKQHPEWIERRKDGSLSGNSIDPNANPDDPKPFCSWYDLCTAGGYRQRLYDTTEEACRMFKDLDGLFFDICYCTETCYCDHCVAEMKKEGIDIDDVEQVKAFHEREKSRTIDGIREILFRYHPDATIYFNSGGSEIHMPQWHDKNTHFELEDLPTTWGGYDKLPIRAKYFAPKGKDYLAMTGKFHRGWGEFGGFKTPEALTHEVASMLTWGAKLSVGDQLHPLGKMDLQTYRNIGKAYAYAESIEDWCFNVSETSDIAVMVNTDSTVNEAIAKLMLDSHYDFDIVHEGTDLSKFSLIIVPDNYRFDDKLAAKIQKYVDNGGKLLILGGGAMKEDGSALAIDCGIKYVGKSEFDRDYIQSEGIIDSPLLCYSSAHKVEADGEVLAQVYEPYFSRTYAHYCSHDNTPNRPEPAQYPAAVRVGNVIYVAHEIAKDYLSFGSVYHRRYFQKMVDILAPVKKLECTNLPATARVRFVDQKQNSRMCVHLLYAPPLQRGKVAVLEDFPVLYNVGITARTENRIKKVMLVPQMKEIEFTQNADEVKFTVDEFASHQLIEMEY